VAAEAVTVAECGGGSQLFEGAVAVTVAAVAAVAAESLRSRDFGKMAGHL
jgi:hypothetical protein